MEKIKIITDSTCDLDPSDIEKYDIEVIPLLVVFGNKSYRDGIDVTTPDLYKMVEERGELPKTAAINEAVFIEQFTKWTSQGYKILCFTISSEISSTYQNACLAAEEVDKENIRVIDTRNLSTGIGIQVLKGAKYISQGHSLEETYQKCLALRSRVRTQFAVEKLDYLHKGGRCSGTVKFFGTLLKIRPVIAVRDGKMYIPKKPVGKPVKGWEGVLDIVKEDIAAGHKIDTDRIFLTHSIAPEGEAYLHKKLLEMFPGDTVKVTRAGCVIASHCGPKTIGILYVIDED